MKTIKQFSESKATEKGERDVGSKAYTDYVTDLTPGAVTNKDAKKSDRETKKTNALKIHRATRLDDATDPEIEQANTQYEREKDELRKQHIKNVANIRSNKIGENLVPDPVPADVYNYTAKKGAIAAPGSGSIAKARKAKTSDTNKSIEQQMADARKEGWEELDPTDVLIEYENEEVEEDATYSERISKPVPAGNASGARGTSKARKYKQVTPGQVRDYEKLTAARMFQAYEESEVDEDAPANATGPAIANWDPLLGGKNGPKIYVRKRRKIDARSKDYREAIKRTQARRDAVATREAEHKLNMFGVQSNPFKEETEMKNKKYLTTKEGSLESAAIESVMTEPPVNPNDAQPTLHLPNKYLATKADSLERAVTEVMTERDVSGEMRIDIKRLTGAQFRGKYRMTKAAAQTAGGGITHKGGKAVLRPHREEVEVDETHVPGHKPTQFTNPTTQKMVGVKDKKGKVHTKVVKKDDPKYAKHPEHESVEMEAAYAKDLPAGRVAQDKAQAAIDKRYPKPSAQDSNRRRQLNIVRTAAAVKAGKAPQNALDAAKAVKKQQEEVEIDEKDSRRTDDAIDAYDKSKDASRDADWDTEHGKKKKGDKEKKYAKKERGEIDKDDPDWKHKKGHTGMHGEEMNPLIQATIDELSKKKLGDYIKKAATSKADAAMALQKSTDKPGGQTRGDVNKHVGTIIKRDRGIGKAVGKLVKDEVELGEDKLSYKERQNLPKGAFALPGKGSGPEGKQGGSYPIPDESHGRNALARVSQHGTEAEKATVRRAVHKKFPDIKVSESVMRDLLTLELDETHDPSPDKSGGKHIQTPDSHMGVPVKKLKPSLKGMSPARKKIERARMNRMKGEEVEIDEARSVDSAMSIISSIVKNKQAGEIIHGDRKKSKVDLYSASAIQQVYNALNKKNQEKMEKVISKNRQGLAKMADFSMSMMK